MKKGLLVTLSLLFSSAVYANQCKIYWSVGNYEKAFTPCKEDAEQGYAEAQYILAIMYDEGEGIEQDKQKAVYWYTKAAERGYLDAQLKLAVMYDDEDGAEQDKQKAVYWYTKASEKGHSGA